MKSRLRIAASRQHLVGISPARLFNTHSLNRNNGMSIRRKVPPKLVAVLFLAILIDTALQLVWKSAVLSLPNDGSPWLNVQAVLQNPLFIFVVSLMACQFFNWLLVLRNADLSFAQPVTSLSYVSVFFLSVLFLKEAADLLQMTGILFVLVGVWFISRTDHVTPSQEREV
jgi:drug/metabolite transporter (DMT)-like permease